MARTRRDAVTAFDAVGFVAALRDDPVTAFDVFGPQIPEVAAMRTCPQPANHHSEGTVWDHTRLALGMLADLPAQIAAHADVALRAANLWPLRLVPRTLQQALAVLLHDVAKPPTRRGPHGAWTYHGHDRVGARTAAEITARLGLAAAADRLGEQISADGLRWLVDNHLFWLNTDLATVTDRAVARRFVDPPGPAAWAEDLRVLAWCDTLGSRGPDGRPFVDLLVAAEVRIAATRRRAAAPPPQPQPPLRGGTVMRELGVGPGPQVGAALRWLAARGLSGDAAVAALRRHRDELRDR